MAGRRGVRLLVVAVWAGLLTGCIDPSQPLDGLRYLGVLQLAEYAGSAFATDTAQHVVPESWSQPPQADDVVPPRVIVVGSDTLEAGAPVEITTYTVGGGCTVADGQEVTIAGRVVELKPYDREVGEVCTMQLVYVPHRSTVTLGEPGEWVIRVVGRRVRYQDSTWEQPISAELVVVVR
jgi:hypothetical protein